MSPHRCGDAGHAVPVGAGVGGGEGRPVGRVEGEDVGGGDVTSVGGPLLGGGVVGVPGVEPDGDVALTLGLALGLADGRPTRITAPPRCSASRSAGSPCIAVVITDFQIGAAMLAPKTVPNQWPPTSMSVNRRRWSSPCTTCPGSPTQTAVARWAV